MWSGNRFRSCPSILYRINALPIVKSVQANCVLLPSTQAEDSMIWYAPNVIIVLLPLPDDVTVLTSVIRVN